MGRVNIELHDDSRSSPPARGGGSALAWALVGMAVLGGAWLRLHGLGEQVVLDDEYHAINMAVSRSYGFILSRFQEGDNSIPLTAAYKLLADTTGLDELGLRLPQAISGILLLLVFPLWVRRIAGRQETVMFVLLAALSPQLIFYSRFARPYAVSTFAAGLAVGAFLLFSRTGDRRWLALYGSAGILAAWFHPVCLPFVLAPVVFLLTARRWMDGPIRANSAMTIAAGGIVLAGVAALFGAPALSSGDALAAKTGLAIFSGDSFMRAGWLWSGALSGWVVGLFWLLAAIGAHNLARRHRLEGGCLVFCVLAQVSAVMIARPILAGDFYILARYNLWALPPVLVFVAVGACSVFRGGWRWLAISFAVLLAVSSPLWATYRMPNNFTNQQRYQLEFVFPGYSEGRDRRLFDLAAPAYEWLAAQPPGTSIVEVPWYHFNSAIFYGNLQHQHRQEVRVGILEQNVPGWLPVYNPRLRLRNLVLATDVAELRARGVDYLFVHRDLVKETAELGFLLPQVAAWDLSEATQAWREQLGPPVHEDRWVQVYAVGR